MRYSRHIALVILLLVVKVDRVPAQVACDASRLDRASSSYDFGWFDETFEALDPCVPDGFALSWERVTAFELMALSYLASDSPDSARTWVREILKIEPGYEPSLAVPNVAYSEMVKNLKPRWYTWLWRGNEWYKWAGRGALAAGIVMIPIAAGSNEEPDLPPHPPGPQ